VKTDDKHVIFAVCNVNVSD